MTPDNEQMKDFALRIPEYLYDLLEKRSKVTRRSVNSEIIVILERFADAKEVLVPSKEYIGIIEDAQRLEKEKSPDPE